MQEMRVRSLAREEPLEKETATPIFLPGKSQGQRSLAACGLWVARKIHCPCDNELHHPDLRDLEEFLLLGWGWGGGRVGVRKTQVPKSTSAKLDF